MSDLTALLRLPVSRLGGSDVAEARANDEDELPKELRYSLGRRVEVARGIYSVVDT